MMGFGDVSLLGKDGASFVGVKKSQHHHLNPDTMLLSSSDHSHASL